MTVKLTEEQEIKVLNGEDLYGIMQRVLLREKKIDRNKEHVWVVALAQNHRIIMIELVGLGSPTRAIVEPVDVFAYALQKQAPKIILVHNHPSGELKPSAGDRIITSQMISVGRFVDCRLLDHLIISETGYYSFKDASLFDELEAEAVDLTFEQIRELEAQLAHVQEQARLREQGLLEMLESKDQQIASHAQEKEQMAKAMLWEGFEPAKVAQFIGLTEERVAALAAKP